MARGDSATVALRKAQQKLKEVHRNLAEAERDNPTTGDLLVECIALKERIIARYESLGGTWP